MDSKSGSYKAMRGVVGAETTRSARLLPTAICTGREIVWDELPASNQYYDSDLVVSKYWILLKSQQDGEFADRGFGRVMTCYRRVTLTPCARLWIRFDYC